MLDRSDVILSLFFFTVAAYLRYFIFEHLDDCLLQYHRQLLGSLVLICGWHNFGHEVLWFSVSKPCIPRFALFFREASSRLRSVTFFRFCTLYGLLFSMHIFVPAFIVIKAGSNLVVRMQWYFGRMKSKWTETLNWEDDHHWACGSCVEIIRSRPERSAKWIRQPLWITLNRRWNAEEGKGMLSWMCKAILRMRFYQSLCTERIWNPKTADRAHISLAVVCTQRYVGEGNVYGWSKNSSQMHEPQVSSILSVFVPIVDSSWQRWLELFDDTQASPAALVFVFLSSRKDPSNLRYPRLPLA